MRLAFGTCLVFVAAVSATMPEMTLVAHVGGAGTDDCDGITLDWAGDGPHRGGTGSPRIIAQYTDPTLAGYARANVAVCEEGTLKALCARRRFRVGPSICRLFLL